MTGPRDLACVTGRRDNGRIDPPDFSELRRRIVANIEEDLAREASEARTRREAMLPVVTAAIAEARARGACGDAWLFGSFAWGEPGDRSDVDLLVEDCRSPDGRRCRVDHRRSPRPRRAARVRARVPRRARAALGGTAVTNLDPRRLADNVAALTRAVAATSSSMDALLVALQV